MSRAIAPLLIAALFSACSANDVVSDMFGMPRPAEWQTRRAELVRRLPQARVIVFPLHIEGGRWMSPSRIADGFAKVSASTTAAPQPANVPPPRVTPFSYRYLPSRLQQYSAWTREAGLDADYLFFIEIYTGRVPGAQIIAMDRNGVGADIKRIHWGGAPPADDQGVAAIIKRCYIDALFEPVQKPCPGRGLE